MRFAPANISRCVSPPLLRETLSTARLRSFFSENLNQPKSSGGPRWRFPRPFFAIPNMCVRADPLIVRITSLFFFFRGFSVFGSSLLRTPAFSTETRSPFLFGDEGLQRIPFLAALQNLPSLAPRSNLALRRSLFLILRCFH